MLRALGPPVPALDPALAAGGSGAAIAYVTCATLMIFRDGPGQAGESVQPEAAVGAPQVSADGRTYLFTVRSGLRFSDGSALTAANFARALSRVLDPGMRSPGASLFSDVQQVTASGLRLRIVLSHPSGDLITRLALPYACPVSLGFPVDPAGVVPLVGSGPYYVDRNAPGPAIVVRRNRFYHGSRPHHIDGITVSVGGTVDSDIKAIEDGRADVLTIEIPGELRSGLARRYGVDQGQLFRIAGSDTTALVLNTSRAPFKDNIALRQAVNFALDRAEIVQQVPGGLLSVTPTDQIMPRWIPGWRDYQLYPLAGPDLTRARQLASGNLRGAKAVLWTIAGSLDPDEAQVIVANLGAIGLRVRVQVMSAPTLNAKASVPGAPYDMILAGFSLDYPDPANALERFLGGEHARQPAGNENYAYFDEAAYNQRMASADQLSGSARFQAFSALDADIMRSEAPWAPIYENSKWLLISKRVGCVQLHPVYRLDLATVCLHHGGR
jgi:ABC-type transport system substrate-binding protein